MLACWTYFGGLSLGRSTTAMQRADLPKPDVPTGPDLTLSIGNDELLAVFDQLSAKDLLRSASLVCKRW